MAENRGKFLQLDPYDENIITYVDVPTISITGDPYNILLVNSTGNSISTTPSLNYNPTTNILSSNELTISTSDNIILSSNIIASTSNITFSNCNQNINEISNIFNIYGAGRFQVGIDSNINLTTDEGDIISTASNGMIIQNYGNNNNIICKNGTGVSFQYLGIDSYVLPTTKPSNNDILICVDDSGSPSVLDWVPYNTWTHQHICWNTFSYFKPATDLTVDYLVQSNQAWGDGNGSYGDGLSTYDFGNITISLNAGTYRFSFTAIAGTDKGIVDFTINSVVTSFDMYLGTGQTCHSWDQVITIPGNYTINCAVNSKNPSSTKYFFLPMNGGLFCDRIL